MDPSERLTTFGDESIKTSIEGFSVLNLFNLGTSHAEAKEGSQVITNLFLFF